MKEEDKTRKSAATQGTPWPDLPNPVVVLIRQQPHFLEHIYFSGVCKRWRPASAKKCNKARPFPGLAVSHHPTTNAKNLLRFPSRRWYPWKGYDSPLEHCIGSSHGWLVMREAMSSQISILKPVSGTRWMISALNNAALKLPLNHIIFSASPALNCSIPVLLTGSSNPTFLVFRNGAWVQKWCNITDINSPGQPLQLTNGVEFEGKIYALSLQGTLVLVDITSDPTVILLGKSRAIPSVGCRCFREYLLKSEGEILLVFLISKGSINLVDDIEVFNLDLGTATWVKKRTLGDRTLFIGDSCSMSLSACNQLGYRENCIYFTHHANDDDWWVYSMKDGSISQS